MPVDVNPLQAVLSFLRTCMEELDSRDSRGSACNNLIFFSKLGDGSVSLSTEAWKTAYRGYLTNELFHAWGVLISCGGSRVDETLASPPLPVTEL